MGVKMKYIDAFENKNGLQPEASLIHRFTMKQFTVNNNNTNNNEKNSFSNCPIVFGLVSARVHVLPMPHQNIAMPHVGNDCSKGLQNSISFSLKTNVD